MDVALESALLGTNQHLLVSDDGYSRVKKIPEEVWRCSVSRREDVMFCWNTLQMLYDRSEVPQPPAAHVKCIRSLMVEGSPPWSMVLPPTVYRTYLDSLVAFSKKPVDETTIEYYKNIWVHASSLLSSLKPAKVDGSLVDSLCESVHNSQVVSTFKARAGGYAHPVTYDRFGTVTGRLTVSSGPNILLLKKENRKLLKPSTPGGHVVSLDFSSLEARILLYESGKGCDATDLYADIADRLGGIPRNVVKAAVLAELYGSSRNSLALTLGMSDVELSRFINKVGEIINTKTLLANLKKQFLQEGYIKNKYGRRLDVTRPQDNIFINYYAQSTGVDVAMTGFNKVLNVLGADGIRPLFVLHDALILDVREDRMKDVESIGSVTVPGYEFEFPLKLEKI
jgi:hypothetical protein